MSDVVIDPRGVRYERRDYACDNGEFEDGVMCLDCCTPRNEAQIAREEALKAAYEARNWKRFEELVREACDEAAAG